MNLGKPVTLRTISTWLFCGLLLVALSSLAAAQSDAPPPPPPPTAIMGQGPGPGGSVFHQEFGEGFEHKVVTGMPMSGELVVTRDTTLADGNRIHTQNQSKVYRDADGRVRREVGFELNTPATGAAKRNMIIITDPVVGKRYVLNPQNKTAHAMPLKPPKPGQGAPPPPPYGEAGPNPDGANVTREQLGTKAINGLQATGTRVTRTIPAGKIGNENPIQVVTERWYSTDLQVPLTTTHTDPMMGTVTTNLTNINRTAPDASLFQVPSDYKVETSEKGDMLYMPMKP
jgi:hypothetical protein